MRLDKYNSGAIMGQQIGNAIDKDKDKFLKGELDDEIWALTEKVILTQALMLKKMAEHPVISEMMDANLKY